MFIKNLDKDKWDVTENCCPDDWGIGFAQSKNEKYLFDFFTGAIRESLKDIRRNIKDIKDCFSNHNVDVIFITWKSNDQNLYNEEELNQQIDGIVDFFILQDMKDISYYPKLEIIIVLFNFPSYRHCKIFKR